MCFVLRLAEIARPQTTLIVESELLQVSNKINLQNKQLFMLQDSSTHTHPRKRLEAF